MLGPRTLDKAPPPTSPIQPSIPADWKTKMARSKYYSPRLRRDLISPLYHAAKSKGIPMTALASRLVADGLYRMAEDSEPVCIVAEEPPEIDPPGRV
jgi:hypothetical protein